MTAEEPGKISFETTRPLYAREGLTIAVAFPKDVVAAPSESDRMGWFLSDWGPPIVGTLGLAGVLGYLFYAWTKAGRDPRPGTVVPLFSPPDDLSPAAMRYIVKIRQQRGLTFELGNLWSEASLSLDQLDELMAAYDGRLLRHRVARARLWGLMSKYGWTLWGSIQHAVSDLRLRLLGLGDGEVRPRGRRVRRSRLRATPGEVTRGD